MNLNFTISKIWINPKKLGITKKTRNGKKVPKKRPTRIDFKAFYFKSNNMYIPGKWLKIRLLGDFVKNGIKR